MKSLVFLRHAKSSWEYAVSDRNRPLLEKGIERIQAVAHASRETFESVERFYSSPANRALHTATILMHELALPTRLLQIDSSLYTFEAAPLVSFVKSLPEELETVCLVGHNPALSVLTAELSNNLTQHLPTAAWVKIIFAADKWESLKNGNLSWGLPKQLLE